MFGLPEAAEELGFHKLWLCENYLRPGASWEQKTNWKAEMYM